MALIRITDADDAPVYVDPSVVAAVHLLIDQEHKHAPVVYTPVVVSTLPSVNLTLRGYPDVEGAMALVERIAARLRGAPIQRTPDEARAERDAAAAAKRARRAERLADAEGGTR